MYFKFSYLINIKSEKDKGIPNLRNNCELIFNFYIILILLLLFIELVEPFFCPSGANIDICVYMWDCGVFSEQFSTQPNWLPS